MDQVTGINYLVGRNVSGISALTPLLAADGTPIVTPEYCCNGEK
ncbi:DUF6440 family protein [Ligilactobacillus sp. WC1T17]